jgi:hypothetical protein
LGAGAAAAAPPVPRLQPVAAAARFDIAQGNVEPIPIALPDFIAGAIDRETARDITQIIVANLQRSGVFARIDPATYIERIISFDAFPRFPDWRQIKAQFLVTGRVSREGNSLKAEFRLGMCSPDRRSTEGNTPHRPKTGGASPTSSQTPSTRLLRATGAISTVKIPGNWRRAARQEIAQGRGVGTELQGSTALFDKPSQGA